MGRRRTSRGEVKKIAKARIDILWEKAVLKAAENPRMARRWMASARKIAQKVRIKVPRHMSRRICKECGSVFVPGRNCRVRIRGNRSSHMTVTCLDCGTIRRFYLS